MPEPFRGSRGKAIQPRTLEIFEDLALVDRIVASDGPYPLLRDDLELSGGSRPGASTMQAFA